MAKRLHDCYIAGEGFGYLWKMDDVTAFKDLYIQLREKGMDSVDIILQLAKRFKRNTNDVAILIMDLGERNFITAKGRGYRVHVVTDDDD